MTSAANDRKLRIIETILQVTDSKKLQQAEDLLNSLLLTPKPRLSDGELEALRLGFEDVEAGRVVSEEEFWAAFDEGASINVTGLVKKVGSPPPPQTFPL
jgi:hypothetical protein